MKKVYILIKASTNEALEPTILRVHENLETVKKQFYANIASLDNDSWSKKCLSKDINEDVEQYKALVLTNHKGWGIPYVVKYIIRTKYIND